MSRRKEGGRWLTLTEFEPKLDGLVDSTRVVRDAVHDINNGMQVLASREEYKEDMREYCELWDDWS